MKYEQKPVYIVKSKDGDILKVTGIKKEAKEFSKYIRHSVVDEWPVEFKVKETK